MFEIRGTKGVCKRIQFKIDGDRAIKDEVVGWCNTERYNHFSRKPLRI